MSKFSVMMPLRGSPPPEVPLPRAPLILVIAQIRFPTLLAVRNPDRVAVFQEAIRSRYPYLEREDNRSLALTSTGMELAQDVGVHWRLWDETRRWRATLNQDFLALDTLAYTSRDEFVGRLEELIKAFASTFGPTHVSRIGVRYIDQIAKPGLARLKDLLRPEVLGVVAGPPDGDADYLITQLSAETDSGAGRLLARWGFFPKGATPDPIVNSIDESTWMIDLDVSIASNAHFAAQEIVRDCRACAERIYSIFRWMVTDEFLIEYGAELK